MCELRDQAGIDTTTIARLKRVLHDCVALAEAAVLIVDEAGMAGTRDLATLAAAVERSSAKLVLVGDDRQLPEIEAGGAFARSPSGSAPPSCTRSGDNERSGNAARWLHCEKEMSTGSPARTTTEVAMPNAQAAREALVADWWAAQQRGADALMIAHRGATSRI